MLAALLVPLLLTADTGWTRVDDADGIVVETRPVAGSKYAELRVTASSTKPVEALCAAAFGNGQLDPDSPEVKSRRVIESTTDMRVVYDQVAAPLVSDRDYAVRVRRVRSTGACEVIFELANDRAPPLPQGWVRIEKLDGHWRFEAAGDHTQLTYTLHTDPGGSLPAFLVETSQRKGAVRKVRSLIGG